MLENVQKFACHMATKFWDSGYEDLLEIVHLLSLECRRLETRLCLLYKIVHKLLCYFDDGIFIPSTSLTHHAPHNLVLIDPTLCSYEFIFLFICTIHYFFLEQLRFFTAWSVHPPLLHLKVIYTFINVAYN